MSIPIPAATSGLRLPPEVAPARRPRALASTIPTVLLVKIAIDVFGAPARDPTYAEGDQHDGSKDGQQNECGFHDEYPMRRMGSEGYMPPPTCGQIPPPMIGRSRWCRAK